MIRRPVTVPTLSVVGAPRGVATTEAPTATATPQPARRLGKYTLTDMLGEGAMGLVYRALDPHIDRVVAIKTIRNTVLDTQEGHAAAALRFRNEARAAGRLSHPGIVAIHEYGEDGEQSFIVMEYVEGASLLRCTTPQQRLPLADVLSVMTQLLHALNYAHAHGVWHRDIKPSNLIVTAGGQLKITDFGIARVDATALTHDATIMGSSGYMAPECYHGVELDQRVDLFSCGVLLYELLAGRRPFTGVPGAVMHRLLHEDPPPLLAADADAAEVAALAPFEPIVARAMARDRTQRYPGAQEMLNALIGAAGHPVAPRVSVAAVRRLMAPRAVPVATPAPAPAPALAVTEPLSAPAPLRVLPHKPQPIRMHAPPQTVAEPGSAAPSAPSAPAAPASTAQPVPARATETATASATASPTATSTASAFDPALLATLSALLVPTLGPVARVLVRRSAAGSDDLATLVARLADELPAEARRAFVAAAQQTFGRTEVDGRKLLQIELRALPARGSTALDDAGVQRAERALTQRIGPIARVLVKSARSKAGSREQFITALVDLAADCTDAQALLEELERTV